MASDQNQVDKGCRVIAIWLVIILSTFIVCVAIGIGIFVWNIRQHAGDGVRRDIAQLLATSTLPDDEKTRIRDEVEGLIVEYQAERLDRDPFIAAVAPVRERLVETQPPAPTPPSP